MAGEGGDVCLTSRGSSKPHEDVARCPVFRERNSGRMPIRAIDEYPRFLIEIVINLQRHGNSCGPATEGHLRSIPISRQARADLQFILDEPYAKDFLDGQAPRPGGSAGVPGPSRSEEHTSELQSLMRLSYAVFC